MISKELHEELEGYVRNLRESLDHLKMLVDILQPGNPTETNENTVDLGHTFASLWNAYLGINNVTDLIRPE